MHKQKIKNYFIYKTESNALNLYMTIEITTIIYIFFADINQILDVFTKVTYHNYKLCIKNKRYAILHRNNTASTC